MDYLNEFKKSGFIIKDEGKLCEYIDFCKDNHNIKLTMITHKHHILPKSDNYLSLFRDYDDNIVVLSLDNHIKAHELLKDALSSSSMGYAYVTLLRLKNSINGLSEEEYTSLKDNKVRYWKEWAYKCDDNGLRNIDKVIKNSVKTKKRKDVYKEWSKKLQKFMNEEIEIDDVLMSRYKANAKKSIKTKQKVQENGLTQLQEIGEKISKWQNTEILLDNGEISTNQKEVIKKTINTKKKIQPSGKTIFEETGEKLSKCLNKQIIVNGEVTTQGKINMAHAREHIKNKNKEYVDFEGKTITHRKMTNINISRGKLREIKLENGTISSVAKEAAKKVDRDKKVWNEEFQEYLSINEVTGLKLKERLSKEVEYKGKIMTLAQQYALVRKEKEHAKKPKYKIIGVNAPEGAFTKTELKKMSQSLLKSTKNKPLGNTRMSKLKLNKSNKLHMVGWYIELLQ